MNTDTLNLVPDPVKRRNYDATGRRAAAAKTRSTILRTARELFIERGYAATTMADVAKEAGLSPDTVYTVVGAKPVLFRELIETALSGTDEVIAGEERDYVQRMRSAEDVHDKIAIYAEAVTLIQQRLAPLFLVLREAASANPELGRLWQDISRRRARNMRALTDDLATTGALRVDLTRVQIADVIWTMNSSEYYALLVLERGCDAATILRMATRHVGTATTRSTLIDKDSDTVRRLGTPPADSFLPTISGHVDVDGLAREVLERGSRKHRGTRVAPGLSRSVLVAAIDGPTVRLFTSLARTLGTDLSWNGKHHRV